MGFFSALFGGGNDNDWAKELGSDMQRAAANVNPELHRLLDGFIDTEMAQEIMKNVRAVSAMCALPLVGMNNVKNMSVKDHVLADLDKKIAEGTKDEIALAKKIKKVVQER